jgi:hypothetical protein
MNDQTELDRLHLAESTAPFFCVCVYYVFCYSSSLSSTYTAQSKPINQPHTTVTFSSIRKQLSRHAPSTFCITCLLLLGLGWTYLTAYRYDVESRNNITTTTTQKNISAPTNLYLYLSMPIYHSPTRIFLAPSVNRTTHYPHIIHPIP